ncbi:MAG: LuxR C-terminal-related transcriptional regulator [Slackia sp.]|nr:LuxR C-terminal-related transcriptional regulator [Slackia sp.]
MRLSGHALAAKAASVPDMPYLGISILLAWHYCLWFVPESTEALGLLSSYATSTWLATLACTGIFSLAGAAFSHHTRISAERLAGCSAIAMTAATLVFCFAGPATARPELLCPLSGVALGISNAGFILAWADRYTAIRASFSMKAIAPVFAVVVLASMLTAQILPSAASALFTSLLPLASFAVYLRNGKEAEGKTAPTLLPRETRKSMMRCVATLCAIAAILEIMLTFVSGITPHELRGMGPDGTLLPWNTAIGIVIIGSVLLAVAARGKQAAVYALIPFLVAFGITALCLSIEGGALCSLAAFTVCIGACVMLEVILVAFFGTLASRGYLSAPLSFALAFGIPRLGAALGDGCGIALRESGQECADLVSTICLAGICLLAFSLIAILHQERTIAFLTSEAPQADDTEQVCDAAAHDFGLSPRETEILKLIARGNAVDAVAKKLVVSPYTVQTHVQHIYRKMQVHKRSELMDYLNLRREER